MHFGLEPVELFLGLRHCGPVRRFAGQDLQLPEAVESPLPGGQLGVQIPICEEQFPVGVLNVGNELGMLTVSADAELLEDYVRYMLFLRASFRF